MRRRHPPSVQRALKRCGENIRLARRRRAIPLAVMAERVGVSKPTLAKIERGDPSVQFGHVAAAMFVLGLIDNLQDMAAPEHDELGMTLDEDRLPQRIRLRKRRGA